MKPSSDKRSYIVIGFLLILLGIIVLLIIAKRNDPSRSIRKTDKDTGETVISEPNKTPETFNDSQEIFVLGSPEILERGATQAQYNLFKDTLIGYVRQSPYGLNYDRLKIISKDLVGRGNQISGKIRLGESENVLNFELKLSNLYNIELNLSDPSGKSPNFNSGMLSAEPALEEHEEVD